MQACTSPKMKSGNAEGQSSGTSWLHMKNIEDDAHVAYNSFVIALSYRDVDGLISKTSIPCVT